MTKVKILEFAPTADEIWRISLNSKDGYTCYDENTGLISLLDTAHDAKPRPEIIAIYAGGKATNVARVMDRLLADNDNVQAEIVTFLPPAEEPLKNLGFGIPDGVELKPSTAAGIYIQLLQVSNLRKVKPRFEVIDELRETGNMQTTRRCIEITLKERSASLNFSPRIVWSEEAAESVIARVSDTLSGSDLVIIAGAPPVWESNSKGLTPHNFYAAITELMDDSCGLSIDVRGFYLHECLIASRSPQFIFMNLEEFYELSESWHTIGGKAFPGILIVHNKDGCWVWNRQFPNDSDPFSNSEYFPSQKIEKVFSTIGAGDAMHAGFIKEWICSENSGDRLRRSVIYSQAVASISVGNEKATHGIDAVAVDDTFRRIFDSN